MKVKYFMRKKIITVNKNDSITEAARKLMQNDITGAPVVDDDNKLVGVISEKDIFKKIYPNYQEYYSLLGFKEEEGDIKKRIKEAENIKVKEIMVKDVITAESSDSAMRIGAIMMIKKINRVVIVDNGKLAGIVSRKDIFPNSFKNALEANKK